MPWRNVKVEEIRHQFIKKAREHSIPFKELCELYEITAKTGYKWLARFEEGGYESLKDQRRTPHTSPNKTSDEVENLIVKARIKYKHWAARKILSLLRTLYPDKKLPSEPTVNNILKRNGFTGKGKKRTGIS